MGSGCSRRGFLRMVTAAAVGTVVLGCAAPPAPTPTAAPATPTATAAPAAAPRGKTVTVASPLKGEMLTKAAQDFGREAGLEVNVQYMGSTQVLAKLRAERAQPRTDVWIGAGGVIPFMVAKKEGLLEPYQSPEFRFGETLGNIQTRDREWYWVGAFILALGWAYNTKKLKDEEVPTEVEALTTSQWKGQVEMANPEASGTAALFILSTLDRYRRSGQGEDAGWKLLEKFAANVKRFPESGGAPAQDAAKGDILVGVSFDQQANLLKVKGEPVEFKLPRQAVVLVDPVALVKGAPNPEGARRFIDFLLSQKGQSLLQLDAYMSMRSDVPPPKVSRYTIDDYIKASTTVDFEWAAENFDRVVRRFRDLTR